MLIKWPWPNRTVSIKEIILNNPFQPFNAVNFHNYKILIKKHKFKLIIIPPTLFEPCCERQLFCSSSSFCARSPTATACCWMAKSCWVILSSKAENSWTRLRFIPPPPAPVITSRKISEWWQNILKTNSIFNLTLKVKHFKTCSLTVPKWYE